MNRTIQIGKKKVSLTYFNQINFIIIFYRWVLTTDRPFLCIWATPEPKHNKTSSLVDEKAATSSEWAPNQETSTLTLSSPKKWKWKVKDFHTNQTDNTWQQLITIFNRLWRQTMRRKSFRIWKWATVIEEQLTLPIDQFHKY